MLLLSLLIIFLTGIILIGIFLPQENLLKNLNFKLCLAFGLGIGITSVIYFFHTLFFGNSIKSIIISEILLIFVLLIIFFIRKPKFKNTQQQNHIQNKSILNIIIPTSFFATILSSLISFAIFSFKNPHGTWDAWFIWNVHARFMYRLNGNLAEFFKNCPDWSHPDYPPLLSSIISRGWQFLGSEQLLFTMLIALLFTFGLVFLLVSSISVLKNKNQGYLAGLILLSTFTFIQQGSSQCADIPLAFYFLATFALLGLKDKFDSNSFVILAGIMAGLSAWCKNEGMLFVIAIFAARLFAVSLEKGFKKALNEMIMFLYGVFPLLAGILYFKTQLAPTNDIFSTPKLSDYTARMLLPERYKEIFSQFFISVKYYFGKLSGIPLLLIYALLAGINYKKEDETTILTVITTLAIMITGYFTIYLITPHDLYWHLTTSLYRLMLQLWPSLLFVYFLLVKTPEESFNK